MTLLQSYSLTDIVIFTVLLALAIKSIITFFDWVKDRTSKEFKKESMKINERKQLEQRLNKNTQILDCLKESQQRTDKALDALSAQLTLLIDSDRDDIKSYITKQHHHFCYQQKWIDDFNLNCIERRYSHYQQEGGNSFIQNFMAELRALPKHPSGVVLPEDHGGDAALEQHFNK